MCDRQFKAKAKTQESEGIITKLGNAVENTTMWDKGQRETETINVRDND